MYIYPSEQETENDQPIQRESIYEKRKYLSQPTTTRLIYKNWLRFLFRLGFMLGHKRKNLLRIFTPFP